MPHGFKLCLRKERKKKKKEREKKSNLQRPIHFIRRKKDVRRIHSKIAAWAIATITKASNNKNECT